MNNWQLFLFVGIAFISVDTIHGSLELSSDELTKLQTLADNECPKVQGQHVYAHVYMHTLSVYYCHMYHAYTPNAIDIIVCKEKGSTRYPHACQTVYCCYSKLLLHRSKLLYCIEANCYCTEANCYTAQKQIVILHRSKLLLYRKGPGINTSAYY